MWRPGQVESSQCHDNGMSLWLWWASEGRFVQRARAMAARMFKLCGRQTNLLNCRGLFL